jgi:hypothetical protein
LRYDAEVGQRSPRKRLELEVGGGVSDVETSGGRKEGPDGANVADRDRGGKWQGLRQWEYIAELAEAGPSVRKDVVVARAGRCDE